MYWSGMEDTVTNQRRQMAAEQEYSSHMLLLRQHEEKEVRQHLNGYHRVEYTSGAVYEGELRDGVYHGKGTLYQSNGIVGKGNFNNGYLEGWATIAYTNGDSFEGTVSGGKVTHGTLRFASGASYNGSFSQDQFSQNLFHGQGTLVYASGHRYVGEWINSKRIGNGTLYDASGSLIYSGAWDADQPIDMTGLKIT